MVSMSKKSWISKKQLYDISKNLEYKVSLATEDIMAGLTFGQITLFITCKCVYREPKILMVFDCAYNMATPPKVASFFHSISIPHLQASIIPVIFTVSSTTYRQPRP